MAKSRELGSEKISKLIVKQSLPASIGFLVMSIYSLVDTIYVGRFVGSLGIGAITVVMPISFLISSIGMAIGVGGASIISRALGSDHREKALKTFGNQINLTLHLAVFFVIMGFLVQDEILIAFGGRGEILPYARTYFRIMLYGVPFLAFAMMANNVIRAQGKPKVAMYTMIVPAVINFVLDPIFIIWLDMGIAGAAWATTISYAGSALFALYYFLTGDTEIHIVPQHFILDFKLDLEIFSIGAITMVRQSTVSLLILVLNHTLFNYAGETGIAIYGIINRVMMFALFPVIGIAQGFLPVVGFNFGAGNPERVRESISTSLKYGLVVASMILALILWFDEYIIMAFTDDKQLISQTAFALVIVFIASPLIAVQMIGAGYFQAIGKTLPAVLLTMTKQGFFLIPLVLILPRFFGINGVWFAFPLADLLSAMVNYWYLNHEIRQNLMPQMA